MSLPLNKDDDFYINEATRFMDRIKAIDVNTSLKERCSLSNDLQDYAQVWMEDLYEDSDTCNEEDDEEGELEMMHLEKQVCELSEATDILATSLRNRDSPLDPVNVEKVLRFMKEFVDDMRGAQSAMYEMIQNIENVKIDSQ